MKKIIQDFTSNYIDELSDEEAGELFVSELKKDTLGIGKRYKEAANSHLLFEDTSVKLFYQAQKLYCLGFYEACIIVSRSTAEYIANEIFEENLSGITDDNLKNFLLDNIDFRKILNDHFKKNHIIHENTIRELHKIYDVGNDYIHPKKKYNNEKAREDARYLLVKLRTVINFLKTVFQKYDYKENKWIEKKKNNYTGF